MKSRKAGMKIKRKVHNKTCYQSWCTAAIGTEEGLRATTISRIA